MRSVLLMIIYQLFALIENSYMVPLTNEGLADLVVSAKIINYDTNFTHYEVTCSLRSESENINLLSIFEDGVSLESHIINSTAIVATINYSNKSNVPVCGERNYTCQYNGLQTAQYSVHVGKPPEAIAASNFTCISENFDYLHCAFPYRDPCQAGPSYTLSSPSRRGPSSCKLTLVDGMLRFDSRAERTCHYPVDHRTIVYTLLASNRFGRRTMRFRVNNYDIVRPAAPLSLEINEEQRQVTWKSSKNLNILGLGFMYNIQTIYGNLVLNDTFVETPFMIYNFSLGSLPDFDELRIRFKVIPSKPRNVEQMFWSDWGSVGR